LCSFIIININFVVPRWR